MNELLIRATEVAVLVTDAMVRLAAIAPIRMCLNYFVVRDLAETRTRAETTAPI